MRRTRCCAPSSPLPWSRTAAARARSTRSERFFETEPEEGPRRGGGPARGRQSPRPEGRSLDPSSIVILSDPPMTNLGAPPPSWPRRHSWGSKYAQSVLPGGEKSPRTNSILKTRHGGCSRQEEAKSRSLCVERIGSGECKAYGMAALRSFHTQQSVRNPYNLASSSGGTTPTFVARYLNLRDGRGRKSYSRCGSLRAVNSRARKRTSVP